MARSQNGYPANDRSLLDYYRVPGSSVGLNLRKGAVATVLLYLAEQFDNYVEDLDTAGTYIEDAAPAIAGGEPSTLRDDWSFAPRPVRGSTTTLSNHASGTAEDLNATQHPRGRRGTFTKAQVREVRSILDDLVDPVTDRCVVRWGEDYRSAPTDGMHFEIDAPLDAVERVADLIELERASVIKVDHVLAAGESGKLVMAIQNRLNAWAKHRDIGKHITVDGEFGPGTTKAVETFQRALKLDVDGKVGPATIKALNGAAGKLRWVG